MSYCYVELSLDSNYTVPARHLANDSSVTGVPFLPSACNLARCSEEHYNLLTVLLDIL